MQGQLQQFVPEFKLDIQCYLAGSVNLWFKLPFTTEIFKRAFDKLHVDTAARLHMILGRKGLFDFTCFNRNRGL